MTVTINVNVNAPELANALHALAASMGGVNFSAATSQPVASVGQAPTAPVNPIGNTLAPVQQPQQIQQQPPQQPMQQPIQQQQVQQQIPQQQMQQPAQNPTGTGVPTTAPGYTMDQLAVAATQLMDAGRQPDLMNLLAQFNVRSLMELPKEQYGAFATALRGLGANV